MRIRAVRAVGWRNLAPLELRPSPRLSVLWGENGQGKTNLLEAIYYLATMRSFRTTDASELISHGANEANLGAEVEALGLSREVRVRLAVGERSIVLDGKNVRVASAMFGAFNAVLFVPEDLQLARAAPSARRRFLDFTVFAVERPFYQEASRYQRLLRSRNALLRKGEGDSGLLDTYDEELARAGSRVVCRRRDQVAALGPHVAALFRGMHADLNAGIRYRSAPAVASAAEEEAVRGALLEGLRRGRRLDLQRGYTGFGPHTDDLELILEGRLAREHASQGQTRSLILALKLAELVIIEKRLGESPVLLLDDVASELDAPRRSHLFEIITELSCQTLLTTTEATIPTGPKERIDFRLVKGCVAA